MYAGYFCDSITIYDNREKKGKRGEVNFLMILQAGALKYCSVSSGEGEDLPSIPLQNFFSTDCKVPDGKPESVQSLNQGNSGHGTQVDASVNVSVSQIFPKVAPREFSSQERDNALTRYKEKKKCRRYNLCYVLMMII